MKNKFISRLAAFAAMSSLFQMAHQGAVNAEESMPRLAALKSHVVVSHLTGAPQYAYEGTGWRLITQGKVLKPGATVRASEGSSVLLRMEDSSFIKVSSGTRLHLTSEAPPEEKGTAKLAMASK
jgi:hypothetical protein